MLERRLLLAVNDISGRLTDWVDSLGKDAANACQDLACLRGVHRPSGERLDVVLLLVMTRQANPKLHFFAKCDVPENKDEPGRDVIPDSFPFVASLRVSPSVISPAYSSVKIVTNETLAEELAEYDMAWKLHPLRWDLPDSHRLTDHVVTGLEAAFVPPQGKKRKASRVDPTADIPDGDPLQLGEATAAGHSKVSCPVLGAPPRDAGAVAAEFVDGPSDWIPDLDMEELFCGLDQDAREAVGSEWFGHEGCIDDSLLLDEDAAAADDGDDASDSSNELDDPVVGPEEEAGDAPAAAAESEAAAGAASGGGAAPAAATGPGGEPSLDDFVLPRGCSLRFYPSQSIPGQSFWLAKIPGVLRLSRGPSRRRRNFPTRTPSSLRPRRHFAPHGFGAGVTRVTLLRRWIETGTLAVAGCHRPARRFDAGVIRDAAR